MIIVKHTNRPISHVRRYIAIPSRQSLGPSFLNHQAPIITSPSHNHKNMSQLNTDLAAISTISDLYRSSRLHPAARDASTLPPSSILNGKIALVRTSITTLAVTSIVNAANQSLLGGGGVVSALAHSQPPARALSITKRIS